MVSRYKVSRYCPALFTLYTLITSSEFQQHFNSFSIKFKSIPFVVSIEGGGGGRTAWECLIGIVQCCISKTIRRQTISYFNFLTVTPITKNNFKNELLTHTLLAGVVRLF